MSAEQQPGWYSTKPGRTKYHFYGADGESLCAYRRQAGPLHPFQGTQQIPADACQACSHPRHEQVRRAYRQKAAQSGKEGGQPNG